MNNEALDIRKSNRRVFSYLKRSYSLKALLLLLIVLNGLGYYFYFYSPQHQLLLKNISLYQDASKEKTFEHFVNFSSEIQVGIVKSLSGGLSSWEFEIRLKSLQSLANVFSYLKKKQSTLIVVCRCLVTMLILLKTEGKN